MDHPPYESEIYSPYMVRAIAARISKWCEELKIGTVACTGISGLGMAAPLSAIHDLKLIIVRYRMGRTSVEGPHDHGTGPYAIVDDLISSGYTVDRIVSSVHEVAPELHPAAIFLYHSGYDHSTYKSIPVFYVGA